MTVTDKSIYCISNIEIIKNTAYISNNKNESRPSGIKQR